MNYNQITKNTYNSISENWDSKRQYIWKPVKEFLESFENKGKLKLLDLGCGTGRFLELAKELNYENKNLIGCDYSTSQLEIVKSKGFKTIQGELTNLPFENKSFDIIICIAAHHHLLDKEEQLKSLNEMKRVLKSNGKILLSNWFPEKEFVEEQIKKNKFEFLDTNMQKVKVTYTNENKKLDRYYYLFKEKELIDLCKEADFKTEKKEYDKGNLYLTLV
jgi:ubiquinone/menaquinone biosynthesis C-methylase UbiE